MPNRSSKPKRPRDANQLAKAIVDLATGEAGDSSNLPTTHKDGKDPAAVELGRRGGLKGGKARAESLSDARKQEIARQAAAARWKKRKEGDSR